MMNYSFSKFYGVFFSFFLVLGTIGLLSAPGAFAQDELNRVSAVERSDGMGYVVRFHLSEPVDSSTVMQPSANMLQILLYSPELDTVNFIPPASSSVFRDFEVFNVPSGIAMNIHIHDGHYFNYSTYPDRNQNDLLLALTTTTDREMTGLTQNTAPVDWSLFTENSTAGSLDEMALSDSADEEPRNGSQFEVIVIDAGHGGKDPGTNGGNIREKDITLSVALKVGEYIKENIPDLEVVFTRTDDEFIGLEERGKIANEYDGDLFVSIHANAFAHQNKTRQRSVHGAEVYFLGMTRSESALEVMKRENSVIEYETGEVEELTEEDLLIYELMNAGNMATSQRIAEKVEYQFRERAQRRSRGVKQAGFQVLYEASMPGVLIELGFLSNPNEADFLTTDYGQSIVASAIYRSIRDFKLDYDRSYNRPTSSR